MPTRDEYLDSFITERNGRHTLQFQHTEDDGERHIRAYVTTLLGSLHCRTDVQLAGGKALFLKYVSSYVTKMHESATSEGLYCTDVTGYQAAHSFLRTVTPLEPEMVFQLSNINPFRGPPNGSSNPPEYRPFPFAISRETEMAVGVMESTPCFSISN